MVLSVAKLATPETSLTKVAAWLLHDLGYLAIGIGVDNVEDDLLGEW